MSEDYLWDRSGDDPEVKRLENVLAALRYDERSAPVPVAEQAGEKRWYRAFSLKLAFAGFIAAVVSAGMALEYGPGPATPPTETASVAGAAVPDISEPDPPALPGPVAETVTPRASRKSPPVSVVRARVTKKASPHAAATAALTEKEKFAYDQLMLALSISGSKLKLVRDAVDGVEKADDLSDQSSK